MTAIGKNIYVQILENEKTEGIITYIEKDSYTKGKVISVGAEVEEIVKDDIIYFLPNSETITDKTLNLGFVKMDYVLGKE